MMASVQRSNFVLCFLGICIAPVRTWVWHTPKYSTSSTTNLQKIGDATIPIQMCALPKYLFVSAGADAG